MDGTELALRSGLDPAALDDADGRLPLSATTTLWRLAVEATGNHAFGLSVARLVRPSTFAGLSMGIVTSSTLYEAFERINRFQAVVLTPPGRTQLAATGDIVSWTNSFPGRLPAPDATAMEAVLASIVLCGRFLTGRSFAPVTVHLQRSEHPTPDVLTEFFGCDIEYGAEHYRLDFDADTITRPLATGSPKLAEMADQLAEQLVGQLVTSTDVTDRVKSLVLVLTPDGQADKRTIAAALAMSPRTLQRRLADEGTTLSKILIDVKREQACSLLADGSRTVAEIAHRLGFHDASSFRRSFRKWTGVTPRAFASDASGPVLPPS